MSKPGNLAEEVDVLVLAYNRPRLLSRVLDVVDNAGPRSISVWIDGPKPSQADEAAVSSCHEIAINRLHRAGDSLHTCPTNLGCRASVSSAIDWFFSTHQTGAVLEDDTVPSPRFWKFVEEALSSGPQLQTDCIGSVTGTNLLPSDLHLDGNRARTSVFFSSWGWATWATQWQQIRKDVLPWTEYKEAIANTPGLTGWAAAALHRKHKQLSTGVLDSWASVVFLEQIRLGFRTLIPPSNEIQNIGFGGQATHTRSAPSWAHRVPGLIDGNWNNPCSTDIRTGIASATLDAQAEQYMASEVFEFLPFWSPGKTRKRIQRRIRTLRCK